MDKPSLSRQERYNGLCFAIDRLVERYPHLPPGRAQAECQAEIDRLIAQVDALNTEVDEVTPVAPAARETFSWNVRPPLVATGALLICVSFAFSFRIAAVVGLCMCAVGLGLFSRPAASGGVAATPDKAPDQAEVFRWRP